MRRKWLGNSKQGFLPSHHFQGKSFDTKKATREKAEELLTKKGITFIHANYLVG